MCDEDVDAKLLAALLDDNLILEEKPVPAVWKQMSCGNFHLKLAACSHLGITVCDDAFQPELPENILKVKAILDQLKSNPDWSDNVDSIKNVRELLNIKHKSISDIISALTSIIKPDIPASICDPSELAQTTSFFHSYQKVGNLFPNFVSNR